MPFYTNIYQKNLFFLHNESFLFPYFIIIFFITHISLDYHITARLCVLGQTARPLHAQTIVKTQSNFEKVIFRNFKFRARDNFSIVYCLLSFLYCLLSIVYKGNLHRPWYTSVWLGTQLANKWCDLPRVMHRPRRSSTPPPLGQQRGAPSAEQAPVTPRFISRGKRLIKAHRDPPHHTTDSRFVCEFGFSQGLRVSGFCLIVGSQVSHGPRQRGSESAC